MVRSIDVVLCMVLSTVRRLAYGEISRALARLGGSVSITKIAALFQNRDFEMPSTIAPTAASLSAPATRTRVSRGMLSGLS